MVSGKSLPNGNIYDQDRPYMESEPREDEPAKREDFKSLTDPELEKHWKEIFDSPEINQEFKEDYFKDLPSLPDKSEFSHDKGDKRKSTPEMSRLLTGTFSNKLKILREAIDEIDREVEKRIKLGKSFRERINSELFSCRTQLKYIENYTVGYNSSVEFRRLGLERQIALLTKEFRSEQLRAWEDVVSLVKEKRTFIMEYKNLMNTRKMLSK